MAGLEAQAPEGRRIETLARHVLESAQRQPCRSELHKYDIVVVGGSVLDIQVTQACGGVGRNIAETLTQLEGAGVRTLLVSVVADDAAGAAILTHHAAAGMPEEGMRRVPQKAGVATPTACMMFTGRGELASCVVDASAVETQLTAAWVRRFRQHIRRAALLVLDANAAPGCLEVACQLAAEGGVPVLVEPVSVPKSCRVASVLAQTSCITPNQDELRALARFLLGGQGGSCASSATSNQLPPAWPPAASATAAACVLRSGVQVVVLTLGALGAALFQLAAPGSMRVSYLPAAAARVVNVNGAGDSLVAGLAAARAAGRDWLLALACGMMVAQATVQCQHNVPGRVPWPALEAAAMKHLLLAETRVVTVEGLEL